MKPFIIAFCAAGAALLAGCATGPTSSGPYSVVAYKPKGDKMERLISQIDLFEGGSVLLPKDAPWLEAFVAELLSFPGRHDDQVDALTQGLAWRRETPKGPLVQRRAVGLGG